MIWKFLKQNVLSAKGLNWPNRSIVVINEKTLNYIMYLFEKEG